MIRSAAGKVMWVGRATVFLVGLAVILALVLGVATSAMGANGQNFILGKLNNAATTVTGLVGNVDGAAALRVTNPNAGTNDTALDLRVQAGEAPMRVNSATKVANLNADKLDGKDSTQIGVNGLERVAGNTSFDSNSPKSAYVSCPTGKIVVGTGYDISGAKSGSSPNTVSDVVVDQLSPSPESVAIQVYEEDATSLSWGVFVYAMCAKAP